MTLPTTGLILERQGEVRRQRRRRGSHKVREAMVIPHETEDRNFIVSIEVPISGIVFVMYSTPEL